MDGKEGSHFNNIMILVVLVVVIGILGFSTLKNQGQAPVPIVSRPRPSPTPVVILIETPPVSQTPSAGMTIEEAQQQKPPPPMPPSVANHPNGISLLWAPILKWPNQSSAMGDIVSYNIYRSEQNNDFKKIAFQKSDKYNESDARRHYEFIDSTITIGKTYTYAVSAVNIFQKESDKSESITIKVPEFPF